MAVYNEIGIGRWNRFIQKLTDMKGSPPARQLSSEIGFNHIIQSGAENRYLESWDRFAISFTVAAVAANADGVQFRNPAGSNVIAVFESLWCVNTGATAFNSVSSVGTTAADLAVIQSPANIRLDNRHRPQPTLIISTQNTTPSIAALGAQFAQAWTVQGANLQQIQDTQHEITVLPGDALRMITLTVNVVLSMACIWRERLLEPAERF